MLNENQIHYALRYKIFEAKELTLSWIIFINGLQKLVSFYILAPANISVVICLLFLEEPIRHKHELRYLKYSFK